MKNKRIIIKEDVEKIKDEKQLIVGNFLIERCSIIRDFFGIKTELYAEDEYRIIDMFGYEVTTGNSEEVAGFMNGLNGYAEDE